MLKKSFLFICKIPNSLGIGMIVLYKTCLSPFLRQSCRFSPPCSGYALSALKEKNFPHAIVIIARRILKCHPFHRGGYDPL
ncbi:MAG TPA: membrane protein insertion efficiency factor YidD [Candidatus Marinimicrobia bacterium]|nr:membrane protein insertion efficiency factor YidD [Candidatus Neomarinimicrobiota bacterium]